MSLRVEIINDIIQVVQVGTLAPAAINGVQAFEHIQSIPSALWDISHNLGYKPDAHVYSVGGVEFVGGIHHISNNQFQIEFAVPTAGRVRYG